ncbi:MAG: integration host factor subunit beta [Rickettsia endosymbiont of Platyusa sonomae]|uniref:HU family DNA-binding protein n=1 Tax=Candidatus Tisiphia endosymbiont of Sialis lutaria TaxID=2029164 RepID=UPI00312CB536|nr:integration host factor subunit beta [Rickettsia endosymbiont of Platyusa sonomae]
MAKKSDLVNKISENLGYLSREDIKDSVDLVLDYLKSSLAKQHRIEVRGFGSFSIRQRKFPNSEQSYKTVYYRMPKNYGNICEKNIES